MKSERLPRRTVPPIPMRVGVEALERVAYQFPKITLARLEALPSAELERYVAELAIAKFAITQEIKVIHSLLSARGLGGVVVVASSEAAK